MTDNKERELIREQFEKSYWQRFFSPEKWDERADFFCKTTDGKYYLCDEIEDAWFLWNTAYAKGRQSVLSKVPSEEQLLHFLRFEFIYDEDDREFNMIALYGWLLSKLGDDKGG